VSYGDFKHRRSGVARGPLQVIGISGCGVPPRWLRLLLTIPLIYVGSAFVTLISPALFLILVLIDLVDRRSWRFSRVGGLGISMCVAEFVGLTTLFVLWVASGFGLAMRTDPFQRAHNKVFGWWLEFVTRALRFFLDFEFVLPTTERVAGPILTFARHAGPGDAFLLARTVIQDYHRQLRMLGANKLLWDPFMNHMMLRLPYHFCDPNPKDPAADLLAVADMCATMDDDSVMIIFPEGGNWTPGRWEGAIERLESRGRPDLAARATEMKHVLPPRSAGAVAALQARDDLTVVFVVHVGLEDLYSLKEIWKKVPLRRQVQATYWSVSKDEIPSDPAEMSAWLFDQWELVDQWIADHKSEVSKAPPDPST
jgi:1-acyl-sn-glycerol-3-phosphate acyltransferase